MGALPLVGRLLCRIVPAGLFLWAGLAKVTDIQGSINSVDAYDVLPDPVAELVGTLLPWAEIGLAALLLTGLFVRSAGAATAVLTLLFIVGMAQAKARGLAIDCGCFGVSGTGDGVSWWDIVRDVPLLVAGAYLAVRPRGPWQLDNLFETTEENDGFDDGQTHEAAAAAGSR
ncbi:MAG TPA: MauE/DoxX family redox-associated membrane protein [Actinomycetota bacterium]